MRNRLLVLPAVASGLLIVATAVTAAAPRPARNAVLHGRERARRVGGMGTGTQLGRWPTRAVPRIPAG